MSKDAANPGPKQVQKQASLGAHISKRAVSKKCSKSKSAASPGVRQIQERSKFRSAANPKVQQVQDQSKSKSAASPKSAIFICTSIYILISGVAKLNSMIGTLKTFKIE
jgi:hypothetical protein